MLQLEQRFGYAPRWQAFSEGIYGLERGVCIFYTGDSHRMIIPGGRFGGGSLSIRGFPTMQLHIHEDADGKITDASVKGNVKDGGRISLTNYEALMADYWAKVLGIRKKKI